VVKTADGKEIHFDLQLSMARSYHQESDVSLRLGDATRQRKDPLVLNFAGTAAQLSYQRFKFDLDSDGTADSVNLLTPGSGFLTLDRNKDGRINNGSELFGTRSGDGFADLAAYDGDRNGWIDENDTIFSRLRVWMKTPSGEDQLFALAEKGVGAIYLGRVDTPFSIKDAENTLQGQVRATGLFLHEDGRVGSMQQLDLVA